MKKKYIGLATTSHDPAIAVVDSQGEIIFAEATERFMQNKRAWNCLPDNYLYIAKIFEKYCEKNSEITIASSWSKGFFNRLVLYQKINLPLMRLFARKDPKKHWEITRMEALVIGHKSLSEGSAMNIRAICNKNRTKIKRVYYDHHLTHAAASCYSSPFKEALCAVIDGYGEGSSTNFYHYQNGNLKPLKDIKKSIGSLGVFYSQLCALCGWDPMKGEEWKVMGLAPYGKYDQKIKEKMEACIREKDGCVSLNLKKAINVTLKELEREPGQSPMVSADLAHNGQLVFNDIMTKILRRLYKTGLSENLVLGGGCALNSAYNGKILDDTPFKELFVFSAPSDDGNAVGAALLAYHSENQAQRNIRKVWNIQSPYLGERLSEESISRLETLGGMKSEQLNGKKYGKVAQLLSEGKIVGWIQGRAEFGPRALGNRSIIADPRRADIKDRLNREVKFREEFRPFTPSILHECGHEYFKNYKESPYMERALKFRKEVMDKIPGVVHVDGTGRLQTVKREWNEKYYDLISAFNELTGVPLVLNTSFNVMGKPIIHTVEDAIAVFYTSGLDALVIEDRLYVK